MSRHGPFIDLGHGFWNIRATFRRGGVNIGTQSSLVRRSSGRYVLLDCCDMTAAVADAIAEITNGGDDIDAIVNLHPFHSVYVRAVHERYPHAKLYGTARHKRKLADLPWQESCTEDAAMAAVLADDLELSIPRGIDFVSANPKVHVSAVLALHRASGTIHSDDTLSNVPPGVLRPFGFRGLTGFHPALGAALERRAGAARDFRAWAEELIADWGDATNLCAAHLGPLLGRDREDEPLRERLRGALDKCEKTLRAHERRYGDA